MIVIENLITLSLKNLFIMYNIISVGHPPPFFFFCKETHDIGIKFGAKTV